MVAQEFLDAFAHVDAFLDIADHRIAAIDRPWVRFAHAGDGVQDGLADAGVAHVARQHGIAVPQRAAGGDAVHQIAHSIAGDRPARSNAPYPVWLENCTVLIDQTSAPSRCRGNTALALPTWP